MKKIIFSIIFVSSIFSIVNITKANSRWIIENLLNLNYWPEIYNLSLETLDTYYFNDNYLKQVYSNTKSMDSLVRKKIIDSYKNGVYSYTTTNWIINNYKKFIYYTNKFFYYLSLVDDNHSLRKDKEVQSWLLRSYENSRIYYKKVKYLINKKNF